MILNKVLVDSLAGKVMYYYINNGSSSSLYLLTYRRNIMFWNLLNSLRHLFIAILQLYSLLP